MDNCKCNLMNFSLILYIKVNSRIKLVLTQISFKLVLKHNWAESGVDQVELVRSKSNEVNLISMDLN